jgi:tetratricopeptide (TPR) repeat protein
LKKEIAAFVLVLAVFLLSTPSASWGEHAACDDVEALRQFEFAEHLFDEEDFFRAIGEYKRFLFLYSEEDNLCEEACFKIALCYFRAKHWAEAVESLATFIERFPDSTKRPEAEYLKGKAEHELGLYEDALTSFRMVVARDAGELRNKALFESALVYVDMREWEEAGRVLAGITTDSTFHHPAAILSEGLGMIDDLPRKSPVAAGTMAALLPGAGHVYTGHYRDGLVAFLLNGLFIWAAVELFDNGDDVAGGIVTFFELGWYTGNIYSAAGSAHAVNRHSEDSLIQSLKARSGVSLMRDNNGSRYLALSITF